MSNTLPPRLEHSRAEQRTGSHSLTRRARYALSQSGGGVAPILGLQNEVMDVDVTDVNVALLPRAVGREAAVTQIITDGGLKALTFVVVWVSQSNLRTPKKNRGTRSAWYRSAEQLCRISAVACS